MPLFPLLIVLAFIGGLALATPFLLVLRYRAGSARRRARPGIAALNLVSMISSAGLFLWIAAVSTLWIPRAFPYSLTGIGFGCALGALGLFVSRWESTPSGLYYTPSRWLVLLLTVAVAMRLLYGIWRAWHAWHVTGSESSWLASAGIAGSMAVGALVIGYYLTYSVGVCWQLRHGGRSAATP